MPDPRWRTMVDFPAAIPLLAIQRLRCPKCQARMTLARILPGPTGFELRTFDSVRSNEIRRCGVARWRIAAASLDPPRRRTPAGAAETSRQTWQPDLGNRTWATGPESGLLVLQKRFYLLVELLERHSAFESLAIDEEGRRRIDL